ncbi:hypothetical protein [Cesiribacter sp. SM1]|uniref:hypothetical protein n=1 Tax=Cesiribacter sp. SM1 TaxID=2861196 RepID=UPI001CD3199B|nr:hypothetical protein [Cesiribacter sp. SM1]
MNLFSFFPLNSKRQIDKLVDAAQQQVPSKKIKNWAISTAPFISQLHMRGYYVNILLQKGVLKKAGLTQELKLVYDTYNYTNEIRAAKKKAALSRKLRSTEVNRDNAKRSAQLSELGPGYIPNQRWDNNNTPLPRSSKFGDSGRKENQRIKILYCGYHM